MTAGRAPDLARRLLDRALRAIPPDHIAEITLRRRVCAMCGRHDCAASRRRSCGAGRAA